MKSLISTLFWGGVAIAMIPLFLFIYLYEKVTGEEL
jgi:hypothetical protein